MAVVSMSKQEFSRLDVLLRVQSGRLRIADACALLDLRRRQVFRLLRDLKRYGAPSLLSKRRGKPSNRRLPADVRTLALSIVRERYADFGPTFAAEKLAEQLHAATTYLMPEFLNSSLNQRQDQYGGSPENRARIVLEALEAMIAEWGTGKVGIKMARPQRWAASIRLGRPFQPTIIWSRG
jgi:hypothetical protein